MTTATSTAAAGQATSRNYGRAAARLFALAVALMIVALGATARAIPHPHGTAWRSQVVTAGTVIVEWGWHLQVNTEYAPEAAQRLLAVDPELTGAIGQSGARWLLVNGPTRELQLQGASALAMFAPQMLLDGELGAIERQALIEHGEPTDPSIAPFVVDDDDPSRATQAALTLATSGELDKAVEVLEQLPRDSSESRELATVLHGQASTYELLALTLPYLDPAERPLPSSVATSGGLPLAGIRFLQAIHDRDLRMLDELYVPQDEREDLLASIEANLPASSRLDALTMLAGQGRELSPMEAEALLRTMRSETPGWWLERAQTIREVAGDSPAVASLSPLFAEHAFFLRINDELEETFELSEQERFELATSFADLALSYDPWNASAWNQLIFLRTGPERVEAAAYAAMGAPDDPLHVRNLACELIWSEDDRLQAAGEAMMVRIRDRGGEVNSC